MGLVASFVGVAVLAQAGRWAGPLAISALPRNAIPPAAIRPDVAKLGSMKTVTLTAPPARRFARKWPARMQSTASHPAMKEFRNGAKIPANYAEMYQRRINEAWSSDSAILEPYNRQQGKSQQRIWIPLGEDRTTQMLPST